MKRTLSLLLTLLVLCSCVPTALAAQQTFTLMVYLCGTDLESDGAAATADLREIIGAGVPADGPVTVYIQTGGTKEWAVTALGNNVSTRWVLSGDDLAKAEDVGKANMGAQDTFADFLRFGFEQYPADRYGLVLWDHGNGAAGGVCYDELTDDSLSMAEIYGALNSAAQGNRFAFIGFDACLMASFEMATHLQPFADYMIASEELEPGSGWNYTPWLSMLSDDPGVDVETLGRKIADSFIADAPYGDYATLSVIRLSGMDALHEAVETMASSLTGEIDAGNLTPISRARQNIRSFGEISSSASDMIDLTVFADAFSKFNSSAAKAVKAALSDVVAYSAHTSNVTDVSGLSVLVPYATRGEAGGYLPGYDANGLMPNYAAFVTQLVSQMSSGGGFSFWSTGVEQQDVQTAEVDWFSQYAADTDSYYSNYESYADDSGDSDFSMGSFLSSLFGSGESDFNAGGSSLWGDLTDEDSGDTLGSVFGSLWGDLPQDSALEIETTDGTVSVENPFAGTNSEYAYIATLTAEEMNYLARAEANLMIDMSDDDFPCYVDLGYVRDVFVDWKAGKIYGLFDGTWPTLDGQIVYIDTQISNAQYQRSLISVTLNGKETYLLVVFDEENPKGVVIGATEGYTEAGMPVRGYTKLKEGDVIVPYYELLYWDENDEIQSAPFMGDEIIVGENGAVPFGYEPVLTDTTYVYGFCLNDIFGEYQFTDLVTLEY